MNCPANSHIELVTIEGLLAAINPVSKVATDAINTIQPQALNAASHVVPAVSGIVDHLKNGKFSVLL